MKTFISKSPHTWGNEHEPYSKVLEKTLDKLTLKVCLKTKKLHNIGFDTQLCEHIILSYIATFV
jgi:hypothetical protein